jgi:hypothetical protein
VTAVASDTARILDHLNNALWSLYADVAGPVLDARLERSDFLAQDDNVVLTSGFVALPRTYVWPPVFRTTLGARVAVVSREEVSDNLAELPPAVLFQNGKIKGAGRSGDPVSGDTLVATGTVKTGPLTTAGHYIGATTPTDASTSAWGVVEHLGNDFLIDELASWFAHRAGDRTDAELKLYEDRAALSRTRVIAFARRSQ